MNQYTVIVAGKSGGHIIPGLTIAQHIHHDQPTMRIHFFTTDAALDKNIIKNAHHVDHHIALPLRSVSLRSWWNYPWYLCIGLMSCFTIIKHLLWFRPQRIISMGGLVSIPVVLIGWVLRIPIELYELNAIPGKAVAATARFAQKINVCFEQTRNYFATNKCHLSPYPIRFNKSQKSTIQARHTLQLELHLPTLLIAGGSQGSLWINNSIKQWVEQTNPHSIQIIHQTGAQDLFDWQTFYLQKGIVAKVFAFANNIEQYYQAADVIVARAGAGTLFEIAHFNKTCIIIPLETKTTDHQVDNAKAFVKDYPHIATLLLQQRIEKNNLILFNALNHLLLHAAGLYEKNSSSSVKHSANTIRG